MPPRRVRKTWAEPSRDVARGEGRGPARTSLIAWAATSKPRAPRAVLARAALRASPRRPCSLPTKPTERDCVRTGTAATAPRDATGARADATTPAA